MSIVADPHYSMRVVVSWALAEQVYLESAQVVDPLYEVHGHLPPLMNTMAHTVAAMLTSAHATAYDAISTHMLETSKVNRGVGPMVAHGVPVV